MWLIIGCQQRLYLNTMQAEVNMRASTTLEQSVCDTIKRDLKGVLTKIRYTLIPKLNFKPDDEAIRELRNWDLWGPLILCLLLSFTLNIGVTTTSKSFGIIFVIMWGGAFIVTLNSKLLGGHISFFQCVCALGYCIFPINIAAFVIVLLKSMRADFLVLKLVITGIALVWSTMSSISFTAVSISEEKRLINVYPIFLFYLFIAWFLLFI